MKLNRKKKKIVNLLILAEVFIFSQICWGIEFSSTPQLDFTPDWDSLLPAPESQDVFPSSGEPVSTEIPQTTSNPPQLLSTDEVADVSEEDIRQELQPLVEDYLTDTGRDLNILDTALNNFTQLITSNLFTLNEVKNVLSADLTPQLEPVLAEWFQLQEKLDLTDLNQVKTLVGFADLCLKGKYTRDDIASLLQKFKPKTEIGLEGVESVGSCSEYASEMGVSLADTIINGRFVKNISIPP
ncbi:hypothetical protein J7K43_08765, partial [Candidatus Calescamantes bacterium]|nr:hypothetical protein [Candidatus Calescamantes bacterium]